MKKFRFNLESLLQIREWEERKAQQAFAEAIARVTEAQRAIESAQGEKENAYLAWQTVGDRRFSPAERIALQAQVAEVEGRIAQAEQRLAELEEARRETMEALKVASRNKRVVENLKEKRLQEYRAESLKQESMEIEDIFNGRRSA
ncbi:flagellar FliJ family protein [Pelagicoccus sp. SDUM812003]|uniref:flagellar export protein FliJ n=1 Tax=Pelagicoccus sp. SDUM812003 TaxID=3041267 RepID=UPI00280FA29F|nr:flagellar FliJ family protein [Pelagicoccus sp. SDUM812003]MDQ8202534.1 flagellar FliJ family protein [Pelagicoccus sp. SDUM812003]